MKDYLISTIDKPAAVHIFGRKVVVVGQDGQVHEIRRDAPAAQGEPA